MNDVVKRLRTRPTGDPHIHAMVHEAADEIERLRARNKRLEEALENFNPNIIGTGDRLNHALLRGAWNKARAELED